MKVILIIFCSFLYFSGCSQSLSDADITSRKKAEIVLNNEVINYKVKGKEHIIFSIADKDFIILVKEGDLYNEYYIKMTKNNVVKILSNTTVQLSKELANSMFNEAQYKKGFTTFSSDFYDSGYELSAGNITYFVFKDEKGRRFGESRLSVFIKPNPIDSLVYNYFVKRYIAYSKTF